MASQTGRTLKAAASGRALGSPIGPAESPGANAQPGSRLIYGLLAIPLLIAAFAGLPRLLRVGPVSGQGALTLVQVGLAAAAVLACRQYPIYLLKRLAPLFLFLLWVGMSLFWAPPDMAGLQNGLVYLLFALVILLSSTLAARHPARVKLVISRGVGWITLVALSLVVMELKVHGLTKQTEEGWWIGPRPLAILGVVTLTQHLVNWYYGHGRSRLYIVLWMAAIVVSISRAAAAIALVLIGLVVLAQMRFRLKRAVFSVPVFAGALLVVAGVALLWGPLRDHMFTGDTKLQVGGTKINVSGRWTMWSAILDSAREHPLIGQGLGSAVAVITSAFASTPGQMTQPHNDYLRLWHDLGLIGLGLFVLALLTMGSTLFRAWYTQERRRASPPQLEFAGLLTLLAISASSMTDNPLVYPSVMATAGIFIGAGLGAGAYQRNRDRAPASFPEPAGPVSGRRRVPVLPHTTSFPPTG